MQCEKKELSKQLQKEIQVSTETIQHTSHMLNYGRPVSLLVYVVRCLHCDKECVTSNIIDGEEKYGKIENPVIALWSAKCKRCLKEWYF